MKKLVVRVLMILGILMLAMAFVSCELIGNLFGGDGDGAGAGGGVARPENKLSNKPLKTEKFNFISDEDLDDFYFFNIEDENEEPEWIRFNDSTRGVDSFHMEPKIDNSPSDDQADMAWLIDLGEDFNFSFTFKTPANTSEFAGPNLAFRYDYDDTESEYGVINVMIRKKPAIVSKAYEYNFELLVDQWKSDRSTVVYSDHVGDYQAIDQLISNTWYTINISVRGGKFFIVDLSFSSSKGVVDRSVSYTFFGDGKESFYNPTFWAYLDGDDSRIPLETSDEYWIGSVEATIPED